MKQIKGELKIIKKDLRRNWSLYLLVMPVLLFFFFFEYKPMYGALIAFQDYRPATGFGAEWVGFKHFIRFFESPFAFQLIRNSLMINVLELIFSFPVPIILSLILNEIKPSKFKTVSVILTYLPHFISIVIVCGMIKQFCLTNGLFNDIIVFFGGKRSSLLQRSDLYRTIYVGSGVWRGMGWGTIIYTAALSAIDSELYDAAAIDGAGRWKQTLHVTLPGIAPTIITFVILRMGSLLGVGYEKTMLLYNDATMDVADVISTYVYRKGLGGGNQYSFSTAVSLMNTTINLILLTIANKISRKVSETSLW